MHGPQLGNLFAPEYPLPIPVVDSGVCTLVKGQKRRQRWREARNGALNFWRESGLDFDVSEIDGPFYAECRPWICWSAKIDALLIPDTIRIMRWNPVAPDRINFGWYTDRFNAGLVGILLQADSLDKGSRRQLRTLFAHEIGHVLGLAHPDKDEVTPSIMGGRNLAPSPTIHDLASVKSYYL